MTPPFLMGWISVLVVSEIRIASSRLTKQFLCSNLFVQIGRFNESSLIHASYLEISQTRNQERIRYNCEHRWLINYLLIPEQEENEILHNSIPRSRRGSKPIGFRLCLAICREDFDRLPPEHKWR